MIHSSKQLKDLIRNLSKEVGIEAHVLIRIITPREIAYSYKLMFEDRKIHIMTYPIETVLAEKLETVISRSITNTWDEVMHSVRELSIVAKIDVNSQ